MPSTISFVRKFFSLFRDAAKGFIDDNVPKFSASLAYYTIFSLPSMLIVVVGLCSIFYGKEAIEGKIFFQINKFVGAEVASEIQNILQKTTLNHDNVFATTIGLITLLLGATGMFGEIQGSINLIWGLKTNPEKGVIKILINRLICIVVIECTCRYIFGSFKKALFGGFN